MDRSEIETRMKKVFGSVFAPDEVEKINDNTQAKDVRGWDSLAHLDLLAKIEDEFSIRFNFREIASFEHVSDIYNTIQKKVK